MLSNGFLLSPIAQTYNPFHPLCLFLSGVFIPVVVIPLVHRSRGQKEIEIERDREKEVSRKQNAGTIKTTLLISPSSPLLSIPKFFHTVKFYDHLASINSFCLPASEDNMKRPKKTPTNSFLTEITIVYVYIKCIMNVIMNLLLRHKKAIAHYWFRGVTFVFVSFYPSRLGCCHIQPYTHLNAFPGQLANTHYIERFLN